MSTEVAPLSKSSAGCSWIVRGVTNRDNSLKIAGKFQTLSACPLYNQLLKVVCCFFGELSGLLLWSSPSRVRHTVWSEIKKKEAGHAGVRDCDLLPR